MRVKRRLTLLGRSTLLILGEVLANVACWIAAALCFRGEASGDLISLSMLAWVSCFAKTTFIPPLFSIKSPLFLYLTMNERPLGCDMVSGRAPLQYLLDSN